MSIQQFTGYTCPSGSQAGCSSWFDSCRNPLYAFDHPDDCSGSDGGGVITLVSLQIVPSTQVIEVGRSAYVQAIAVFDDGRAADVTGETTFASTNQDVASLPGAAGVVDGLTAGSCQVIGSWRGRSGTCDVTVVEQVCVDYWDVAVVVDDGGVFVNTPTAVVVNETSVLRRAARRYSSAAATTYPDSILQLQLSMDLVDQGAARQYLSSGWNTTPDGTGAVIGTSRTGGDRLWVPGSGWSIYTTASQAFINAGFDLGGGMMEAWQALLGDDRRDYARKLVILFTTGGESSCSPSAKSASDMLVNSGIEVAVVTPLAPTDTHIASFCFPGTPAIDMLAGVASSSCLFLPNCRRVGYWGNILYRSCLGCYGYGYGYS